MSLLSSATVPNSLLEMKVVGPPTNCVGAAGTRCKVKRGKIENGACSSDRQSERIAVKGRRVCNGRRWEVGGNGSSRVFHGRAGRSRSWPALSTRWPAALGGTAREADPRILHFIKLCWGVTAC